MRIVGFDRVDEVVDFGMFVGVVEVVEIVSGVIER